MFQTQWKNNNGKCGLCGDPWSDPRDHELGGKYFTNHISSSYKRNSVIDLTVNMNKNSLGWMEFRIHPYNKDIAQEDLNSYLLEIGGTRTTRYRVHRSGYHVIPVKLPENLECDRCLLQWKYHTGNTCIQYVCIADKQNIICLLFNIYFFIYEAMLPA